ncbi:MAG: hypothetical protein Q7J68_02595 [Thermoplasmata archaeon]|nr:hypothetical protein [Thermoplasmata archaeon]
MFECSVTPGEEASNVGRIVKLDMDRLESRRFELELDCPNCGSARIMISAGNGAGPLEDVACPKCGIRIILDGLNITLVNETCGKDEPNPAMSKEPEIHSTGSIV